MRKIIKVILLAILFGSMYFTGFSQKPDNNKKRQAEAPSEMPPPPPPRSKVPASVTVDTVTAADLKNAFDFDVDDPYKNVDTTSPPNDELTEKIKELLTVTGSFDFAVQFAKALELEKLNSTLPKEFYDRLFKELAEGKPRVYFENMIIKIYRKEFTLNEITDVLNFYNTPTGKKMLSSANTIAVESGERQSSLGKAMALKVYYELLKEGLIK